MELIKLAGLVQTPSLIYDRMRYSESGSAGLISLIATHHSTPVSDGIFCLHTAVKL